MQRVDSFVSSRRPIPLSFILLLAAAIHIPLLLAKLPLHTYDATFHIFFASHYLHHWFDPWNVKWYAGFSQTTYPPLPHQWIAILSHVLGLDMAYMAVQFIAILLLVIGVYRFSRLWVDERSASFAAIAAVFLGSESFLVYAAGQLSTTSAAPIYLNALPYAYEYIRHGRTRALLKALILLATAAAAHHATLLFGSLFFALPVAALAYLDRENGSEPASSSSVLFRIGVMVVISIVAVVGVILPFWIALLHNPVKQVPIPHASRANYLLSPALGVNYFLIPYGALILALPFIVLRGSAVKRLRPLLFGFWLAFMIGLGGTSPVGKLVLGRAYEVLTMERFSYWASLLALPFVGLLFNLLISRYRMKAVATLAILSTATCGFAVAWIVYKPADAQAIDVTSAGQWLSRDGHNNYRYITLGFGLPAISALATAANASSVDGEWNSGRTLPELTSHAGAALSNSKFFGESGLEALRAVLDHADKYGLKWVLVSDPYYDPLLTFVGYRPVDQLNNKTITIWGRDATLPAVPMNLNLRPPAWQGLWWGILPFGSSLLALLMLFIPDPRPDPVPADDEELVENGRLV